MEKTIVYVKGNKRYTMRNYNNENILIFQIENMENGSFYKRNLKYNYSIGCGYTYQVQKTQIKSCKKPVELIEFFESLINDNFAIVWLENFLESAEKVKEYKNF